jgi:glycopeptide antibiotics resistance protein
MKFLLKTASFFILIIYLMILTQQILFKYIPISDIIHHFRFVDRGYHWRSNNFVPFKTIHFYLFLANVNLMIRIENLVGNIIGFVPFGFIFPLIFKHWRKLSMILIATFCLSLTYEVLQLLFEFGSFDVDDLILNTLGGILGYIPFKIFYFIFAGKWKKTARNKKGTFEASFKGSKRA